MAKKNERKALGNDPFANGDSLLAEEDAGGPEDSEKPKVEEKVAAEAPLVEAEEESKAEAKVTAEAPPAESEEKSKAEGQPETEPVEAAADTEAEKVEHTAEVEAVEAAAYAEVEEVEPSAEVETVSAPSALPRSRVLDELMATIDQEVEEAFGPGAMADLSPVEPVGAAGGSLLQHVIFTLAGTEYAAPIANVIEIGRPLDVTPVPNMPDWVLGMANLRGDVISMVDLRAFLGMERIGYGQASRMLVAQVRQEDMTTGLVVDRVSGIRYLAADRIGAPAAPIADQVTPYLRGVYEHDGRLLVVLDFDRLLLSPEMRQFEPV